MSMFANFLAKVSDFFLLWFPFSWKYAGILSSSMFKVYGALFLHLDSTKNAIKVPVLHRNGTKTQQ